MSEKHVSSVRLLDQDEVWVTRDGRKLKVVDMTSDHKANLLAYLRQNVAIIRFKWELTQIAAWPDDPSDSVAWAMDQQLTEWGDTTGEEWLEQRPLVITLRAQLAEHEAAMSK